MELNETDNVDLYITSITTALTFVVVRT